MAINIRSSFSKYLQASDFADAPQVLTIVGIDIATFGGKEEKLVVNFKELEKGLVLNKTNCDLICDLYGNSDSEWKGNKIELYQTNTQFKGKMCKCVRARAPKA
ncbi:MAG: hypothetical protein DRJ03_04700 [Chloroflexi bacterium]|nr:MAG: hypothetical protein DRJ03_04700 [Chloroflexota bacterium]